MRLESGTGEPLPIRRGRGLLEDFGSRAAVFAVVYLCVNIMYQQGYFSVLGIEFGLFSPNRALPIFDNFVMFGYAFLVWGFIVEISRSAYDQFFGFFMFRSWRDPTVRRHRGLAVAAVAAYFYLTQAVFRVLRPARASLDFGQWAGQIDLVYVAKMLFPPWDFITWTGSIISGFVLLAIFMGAFMRYRRIRALGVMQLTPLNRQYMEFHINAITPAAFALGVLFAFVVLPAGAGRAFATISLQRMNASGAQQVMRIEVDGIAAFCGEHVQPHDGHFIWRQRPSDNFTIHLLGSLGDNELFARMGASGGRQSVLSVCLIPPAAIKSIGLGVGPGS